MEDTARPLSHCSIHSCLRLARMWLRGRRVGNLHEDDLLALVENRVPESRTLEYKQTLPSTNDSERKEFLADVSAMANTTGGVIIYGLTTIREGNRDTGVPESLVGVSTGNIDAIIRRLESMVHDGLSPSLAGAVAVQGIEVANVSGPVIIMGVPASLTRPHRVEFAGSHKFFRRNDAGKYEPDVPEIRRMFLESRSWIDEAETFRSSRVARVRTGEVMSSLDLHSSVFVHILPLGRLEQIHDLRNRYDSIVRNFRPFDATGYNHRFNADGILLHSSKASSVHNVDRYTQVFRFGGVEGYSAGFVSDRPTDGSDNKPKLWAEQLDKEVPLYVTEQIKALQSVFGIEPPYAVLVTLCGLRGTTVAVSEEFRTVDSAYISEDELRLPPVVLDDAADGIPALMRPVLEVVWQAGGYPGPPVRSVR